ncbi:MAG TPA: hypothetical protein VMR06_16290 [Dokdonella sp.]|uniref:hypothetical protein n=1 Tax=Dokdonella sp. TaxID=2291710 RepID=UPI002C24B13A|nr:hypothetical protein [Dokdonella sp.]HUD43549.1 hypothetical protein [Dokdonella sp.]
MNLSIMSVQQLVDVIREASAELSSRLADPVVDRVRAARPNVVVREPSEDDKDFALRIKAIVASGGYVSAEDRDRIAALAAEFGPWIKRQGLPTERGTGAWRKLAQSRRIKPAKER